VVLTTRETEFLKSQGLSAADVYVTGGRSPASVKDAAKREGKLILLHTPCQAAGHRLKTRHGHCVQCDTKKIAYAKRPSQPGTVYVAVSKSKRLVKVGSAKDTLARDTKNNFDGYAGARDWVTVFKVRLDQAARVELDAQTALRVHQALITYERDGLPQTAREAFTCSASAAVDAVTRAVKARGIKPEFKWKSTSIDWAT
jgi:hypothetical protein